MASMFVGEVRGVVRLELAISRGGAGIMLLELVRIWSCVRCLVEEGVCSGGEGLRFFWVGVSVLLGVGMSLVWFTAGFRVRIVCG